MIEISLNKVTKNYGFNNILTDISFDIKTKERVALIGSNGCGKTTILKIIAGMEDVNSGMVFTRNGSTIGILNQIPEVVYGDSLVKDVLYKGFEDIITLKEELDRCEQKMSSTDNLDKAIKAYTRLQEEFIKVGGYEMDTRISKVMGAFKINNEMLNRRFDTLSGGERTIVSLASLILSEPDILLLDEPTNHLDIDTIEWLENFLNSYKGTVLIVSHDRYFLDRVANKIILIEREEIEVFNGNYSYFLTENENRIMLEFKNYKNQQKKIEAMKNSIKKLREFGRLASPQGEPFFKRANSIEKRLEKMELLDKPLEKKNIPITFDMKDRSGKDVLIIKDLNISFGDNIIFKNAALELYYRERICIIGKNGSGKSTLIKEILNNNNSSIKIGANAIIGYIPQEIVFENYDLSVLEEAKKYFDGIETYLRSALCKFLFVGDNIHKKLKTLSGGEKVRLKLFCLMQQQYNLLILDEPTNHIDIDTKEILEDALSEYKGTILFISHDRYFINKLATRVINIESKKLVNYIGNYDYYKSHNK